MMGYSLVIWVGAFCGNSASGAAAGSTNFALSRQSALIAAIGI